jgi:hypothetical protein
MVKRLLIFVAVAIQFLALPFPAGAGGRNDTDTNAKESTLNKHQLACLAVAIKEMQRRGWPFRAYQVVITDEGRSYSIAFMEDPLDMTRTGGDGMEWHVRKKDLKLSGPTFYR